MNKGDESLPLGDPPVLEHPTPTGVTEVAQRLAAFPFTPPDVKLKEKSLSQARTTGSRSMIRIRLTSLAVSTFTLRRAQKASVLSRNFIILRPGSKFMSFLPR